MVFSIMFKSSVLPQKDSCTVLVFAFVQYNFASMFLTAMSTKVAFAMVAGEPGVTLFEGTEQCIAGHICICWRRCFRDLGAGIRVELADRRKSVRCQIPLPIRSNNKSLPRATTRHGLICRHRRIRPHRISKSFYWTHVVTLAMPPRLEG
jgi:hypothetical protein